MSLFSAKNLNRYYIYFTVDGVKKDPLFVDKQGIEVKIASGATADEAASAIQTTLTVNPEFTVTVLTDTVTIVNDTVGVTDNAYDGYDYTIPVDLQIVTIYGYVWYETMTSYASGRYVKYPVKVWSCSRVPKSKIEWIYP
jgi:hypothetical protein